MEDTIHLQLTESEVRWLMGVLNEGKPALPVTTAHRIIERMQWWLDRLPRAKLDRLKRLKRPTGAGAWS